MTETLTPTQPKKGRYNNRPRRAGKEGPAGPGDQSLRRAALIAGSALLGVTVLAAYAYVAVIGGLVVDGDAARTASNIAEAEGRFRIGVACFALVAVLDVVIAWALRVLFAPVSDTVASLAAALRVAYAAGLLVATGHLVIASQLLTGPEGRDEDRGEERKAPRRQFGGVVRTIAYTDKLFVAHAPFGTAGARR